MEAWTKWLPFCRQHFFEMHFCNKKSSNLIPHWHDTGSWNPSSYETRTYLFYIVTIIGAYVLAKQGATMIFTAITSSNVHQDVWCHMVALGHKELKQYMHLLLWFDWWFKQNFKMIYFYLFKEKFSVDSFYLFLLFFCYYLHFLFQNFIFMTVTTFGPLTCSIITTTRKFFTILGSVIIFQHPMSSRQWLGTTLVFVGLGLDGAYGKERKRLPKET